MANAGKKVITKEILVEVLEEVVTLQLSMDEASLLRTILYCHITGSGKSRKLADGIELSLRDVGVTEMADFAPITGSVTLSN